MCNIRCLLYESFCENRREIPWEWQNSHLKGLSPVWNVGRKESLKSFRKVRNLRNLTCVFRCIWRLNFLLNEREQVEQEKSFFSPAFFCLSGIFRWDLRWIFNDFLLMKLLPHLSQYLSGLDEDFSGLMPNESSQWTVRVSSLISASTLMNVIGEIAGFPGASRVSDSNFCFISLSASWQILLRFLAAWISDRQFPHILKGISWFWERFIWNFMEFFYLGTPEKGSTFVLLSRRSRTILNRR